MKTEKNILLCIAFYTIVNYLGSVLGTITIDRSCVCGGRSSFRRGLDRITNGRPTTVEEHPYMAILYMTNRNPPFRTTCGGSIISNRYILTAAHCVNNLVSQTSVEVVAGSTTRSPNDGTTYQSEEVWYSTLFNERNLGAGNDIALVRVNRNIIFGPTIQPICLPKQDQRLPRWFDSIVVGWGRTAGNEPISNQLMEANVKAISASDCNESTSRSGLSDNLNCGLSDSEEGVCNGDSGGPMVSYKFIFKSWRRFGFYRYVSGISSFVARGCLNTERLPSVFANVASHREEIWSRVRDTTFCDNPLD